MFVERVGQIELRIRKAVVEPEAEIQFYEESAAQLSDRDRDAFLALLDNPPEPGEGLRLAAARCSSLG